MIASTLEDFCQNPYISMSNRDIHKILSRIWLLNISKNRTAQSIKHVWIVLSVLQVTKRESFLNLKEGREDLILKDIEHFYLQSKLVIPYYGKLLGILSRKEDLVPDTFREVFYGNWSGSHHLHQGEGWERFKKILFNKVDSLME